MSEVAIAIMSRYRAHPIIMMQVSFELPKFLRIRTFLNLEWISSTKKHIKAFAYRLFFLSWERTVTEVWYFAYDGRTPGLMLSTRKWYKNVLIENVQKFEKLFFTLFQITMVSKAKKRIVHLTVEFLEVAFNCILYSRNIYPYKVFIPRKKYGVTVYQASHVKVKR